MVLSAVSLMACTGVIGEKSSDLAPGAATGPVEGGGLAAPDSGAGAVPANIEIDGGAADAEPPAGDGAGPGQPPPDPGAARCGVCDDYAPPILLASVGEASLIELSGATVGWKNPNVIFAHNDGNRAAVHALGLDGVALARFVLTGARMVDLEDIGIGPCPGGTCLVLADVGDNAEVRPDVVIYRIAEPEVSVAIPAGEVPIPFEQFPVTYEDGAHNAEGVLVDPQSGAVYLVTKPQTGPSAIYRLPHPLSATAVNVATKVSTLPIPMDGDKQATSAAAHPCGRGFLVRTYNALYEFRVPPGAAFEEAFAVTPIKVMAEVETQSEAVSYMADGRGYITSGEEAATPIYFSACAP